MKKEIIVVILILTNFSSAWFWYINRKEAQLQKELALHYQQLAQQNEIKAQRNAEEAHRQMILATENAELARLQEQKMIQQLSKSQKNR